MTTDLMTLASACDKSLDAFRAASDAGDHGRAKRILAARSVVSARFQLCFALDCLKRSLRELARATVAEATQEWFGTSAREARADIRKWAAHYSTTWAAAGPRARAGLCSPSGLHYHLTD